MCCDYNILFCVVYHLLILLSHIIRMGRGRIVGTARGYVYVLPATIAKFRSAFVQAGKTHVDKVSTGSWPNKKLVIFLSWLLLGRSCYARSCRRDSVPNGSSFVSERRVLWAELSIACASVGVGEVPPLSPLRFRFCICFWNCLVHGAVHRTAVRTNTGIPRSYKIPAK